MDHFVSVPFAHLVIMVKCASRLLRRCATHQGQHRVGGEETWYGVNSYLHMNVRSCFAKPISLTAHIFKWIVEKPTDVRRGLSFGTGSSPCTAFASKRSSKLPYCELDCDLCGGIKPRTTVFRKERFSGP